MSCENFEDKPNNTNERIEVSLTSLEDDFSPPGPEYQNQYRSLDDWLISICKSNPPNDSSLHFKFGLFESDNNNIIFFIGTMTSKKGDNNEHISIEFQPESTYYELDEKEFDNFKGDQLRKSLTKRIIEFTNSEIFTRSYLQKARLIHTEWGDIIYQCRSQDTDDID